MLFGPQYTELMNQLFIIALQGRQLHIYCLLIDLL